MAGVAHEKKEKKKFDFIAYLKATRAELPKITWPSRQETVMSTVFVFIMAALMALFLFVTDQTVAALIRMILGLNA